jgi:hypothetical protein
MARSGDKCEACSAGHLVKYCSKLRRAEKIRVGYLHCNRCGHRPKDNKETFQVDELDRDVKLIDGCQELFSEK